MDIANLKLVEMENSAFDLVRAGRKEEGQVILQSKEYEIQKHIYSEGLKAIVSTSRIHVETVYSERRQRVYIVIVPIIGFSDTKKIDGMAKFSVSDTGIGIKGKISVESIYGEGSTFTFTIPVNQESATISRALE